MLKPLYKLYVFSINDTVCQVIESYFCIGALFFLSEATSSKMKNIALHYYVKYILESGRLKSERFNLQTF